MKAKALAPDLFADQPASTSGPKLIPILPTTPQAESQLRAELWETAPQHIKGVVSGENCLYTDACWKPIAKLSASELVAAFSLS